MKCKLGPGQYLLGKNGKPMRKTLTGWKRFAERKVKNNKLWNGIVFHNEEEGYVRIHKAGQPE